MRALAIALVVVGLYLVLFHSDPLPLNHEAIGLGKLHLAHTAFGLVALIGAVFAWRRSRRAPSPTSA